MFLDCNLICNNSTSFKISSSLMSSLVGIIFFNWRESRQSSSELSRYYFNSNRRQAVEALYKEGEYYEVILCWGAGIIRECQMLTLKLIKNKVWAIKSSPTQSNKDVLIANSWFVGVGRGTVCYAWHPNCSIAGDIYPTDT